MQLLIHADVGTDYPASKVVSVGYVITDSDGRIVDSKASDVRLLPVMTGVPSPLQFTAGASLRAGRLHAEARRRRRRSRRQRRAPIHAALPAASGLHAERADGRRTARGRRAADADDRLPVTFGAVHGYLEAYGAKTDGLTMEYEIATAPDAPALLNVDVPPHPVSDDARDLHEGDAGPRSCRRASTSCARSCRPTARRSRR